MRSEKEAFDSIREEVTGTSDWLEVRGQKFTPVEARDAQDFFDLVRSSFIPPEFFMDCVGRDEMSLGRRLYLVENLPLDELGAFLLCEEDGRLIKVAKSRAAAASGKLSSDTIILPGTEEW